MDEALVLSKAMAAYGRGDMEGYAQCVELLAETQSPAALFLRSLAQGHIAYLIESEADRLTGDAQATGQQKACEAYAQMRQDLDQALQGGFSNTVTQLINGLLYAKQARCSPEQWDRFLGDAHAALSKYLEGVGKRDLNWIRATFFLGVVDYRWALEAPVAENAQETREGEQGIQRLEEAAELLGKLADVDQLAGYLEGMPGGRAEAVQWASYANFYLGLTYMRLGNVQAGLPSGREGALDYYGKAKVSLEQASTYNEQASPPSQTIRDIRKEQTRQIEEAESILAHPRFVPDQDFTIRLSSGFSYDTNVILLGENTATPPDVGRRRDVQFGAGVDLGYTLNLGTVDPSLSRWSIGLLGRAGASWHADIDEYDEQDYGGSAAIQYQLVDPWDAGKQGPIFLGLQYDYDYFMLGRDGFLRSNRLTPRLTMYTRDQRDVTSFSFTYEDRNYLEQLRDLRFDRDGNYFSFPTAQCFGAVDMSELYGDKAWGRPGDPQPGDPEYRRQQYLRPYIGIDVGWDSTRGWEFDNDHFMLFSGVDVPLPYGLLLSFYGNWEWQDYKNGSLVDFHRRVRDDFVQRYGVGLERRFVLVPGHPSNRNTIKIDRVVMTLRGDMRFTEDDSNVKDRLGENVFSYDRAVYGLSVAFDFN